MTRQPNIVKRLAAPILSARGGQTPSIRTYSDNIIIDDLTSVCQRQF